MNLTSKFINSTFKVCIIYICHEPTHENGKNRKFTFKKDV